MVLLHRRLRTIFSIGIILVSLFFAFNFFGCILYITGVWSIDNGMTSWLNSEGGNFGVIHDFSPHKQYFFSVYFALGTVTSTMGYGDIVSILKI